VVLTWEGLPDGAWRSDQPGIEPCQS
jgi:hypothetical protein